MRMFGAPRLGMFCVHSMDPHFINTFRMTLPA
jgi:hypothetical protein